MSKSVRTICIILLILALIGAIILMGMFAAAMYEAFFVTPDYRKGVYTDHFKFDNENMYIERWGSRVLFDIESGVVENICPYCRPEKCSKKCIFNPYFTVWHANFKIIDVRDGTIYYQYFDRDGLFTIEAADLKTGKIVFSFKPDMTLSYYVPAKGILYGDHIYLNNHMIKETIDGTDWLGNILCRINIKSGEMEKFTECSGNETLVMIEDGWIITQSNEDGACKKYSYSIETKKKTTFQGEEYFISDTASYYDGKLYYLSLLSNTVDSYVLVMTDVKTGNSKTLIDEKISNFSLAPGGTGIYYTYTNDAQSTLKYCDIDGKNAIEIYKGKHQFTSFTVIGGKMYGFFAMYNEYLNQLEYGDLIIYDIDTNSYETVILPELYET